MRFVFSVVICFAGGCSWAGNHPVTTATTVGALAGVACGFEVYGTKDASRPDGYSYSDTAVLCSAAAVGVAGIILLTNLYIDSMNRSVNRNTAEATKEADRRELERERRQEEIEREDRFDKEMEKATQRLRENWRKEYAHSHPDATEADIDAEEDKRILEVDKRDRGQQRRANAASRPTSDPPGDSPDTIDVTHESTPQQQSEKPTRSKQKCHEICRPGCDCSCQGTCATAVEGPCAPRWIIVCTPAP
jgi:hypothetical protein